MKRTLQFFLFLLFSPNIFAQTHSVKGQILDAESGETIIGANISLVTENQVVKLILLTNENGFFKFENIGKNLYDLNISYVGYAPFTKKIEVRDKDIDLGKIKLEEGLNLPEVQVTERILNTLIIGDTTQINADAYKVLSDANAKDLLQKMPSIEMSGGIIKAEGEAVKEILVDGQPFFDDNPNATLKNLPAETVAKVQIYEREAEKGQANSTTEEKEKVINIILKKDKKEGVFGNVYGGYGTDERYQAGGLINVFKKKRRFTLTGTSDNIDNGTFLGAEKNSGGFNQGSNGILTKHSVALNYNDNSFDKLKIYANYYLNQGENTETQLLNRRFFNDAQDETYEEQTNATNYWMSHRFSSRLKYDMNERNKFSLQFRQSYSDDKGETSFSGKTISDEKILSQTVSDVEQESREWSTSANLKWTHKFTQKGSGLIMSGSLANTVERGNNLFLSENVFGEAETDIVLLQQTETSDNNGISTFFLTEYFKSVGENGRFSLMYSLRRSQKKNDQETFDFNTQTEIYDLYNRDLSNVFENDYQLQELKPNYKQTLGNWTFSARVRLQKVKLINQQSVPESKDFAQENLRFLPRIDINYKSEKGIKGSASYSSSTQEPSLQQLQNVTDNSNPLQLKIGNPDLKQAVTHRVRGKWQTANTDKSTSLELRGNFNLTDNYLGRSTKFIREEGILFNGIELAPGTQLTQYVNLDGNWNANTTFRYSFPLDIVKSNMSIRASGKINQKPAIVNEALNVSQTKTGGLRLTLSSNISERVDFLLSSSSSYYDIENTLRSNRNDNYFRQSTSFRLNCIVGNGFVFRTNFQHSFLGNLAEEFDRNYLIWNLNIGKKVFKNQHGEINLAVFDILQQNNSLSRDVTDIYLEDLQTNVLQRYVLLSFKYELRVFEKEK